MKGAMPKTHVALVLDRSGSMRPIKSAVVRCYNDILASLRQESRRTKQDTRVTFVSFADAPQVQYRDIGIEALRDLDEEAYRPDGMTALYYSTRFAADQLPRLRKGDAALCVVITDGEETVGGSAQAFAGDIRDRLYTDQWTFAFHVPPGRSELMQRLGVPAGCIHEWEGTEAGTRDVYQQTSGGLTNYYTARTAGKTHVPKFFTDASAVDTSRLYDASARFRKFNVPQEEEIRPFVERRTRREYVTGSAYYLLMKPETVQASKLVAIMRKGEPAVYVGPEARSLIGLPEYGDAKVEPGNHGDFDIYVQSRSVNRKLPRGTSVLVDVTKHTHDTPTWGNAA